MGLLACVELRDLALTLALFRHPEWCSRPAIVVRADAPNARVVALNAEAAAAQVRVGMRLTAALALVPDVGVGVVSEQALIQAQRALLEPLRVFSPAIESSSELIGVIWLRCDGLRLIYPDLRAWAEAVRDALTSRGFSAAVVVGFSRMGSLAVARITQGVRVLASAEEEREVAASVALLRLGVLPMAHERLAQLGVRTVGEFMRLPVQGVMRRFGRQARDLHRALWGEAGLPVAFGPELMSDALTVVLDPPEQDRLRLLFRIQPPLRSLLKRLRARHRVVATLSVLIDTGLSEPAEAQLIQPAEPTVDESLIADLMRLKFESLRLDAPAERVQLEFQAIESKQEQLLLWPKLPRRDLGAANRALARLRAEIGEQSIVTAQLRDSHLPEARFEWIPWQKLDMAQASQVSTAPLVRRILVPGVPLAVGVDRDRLLAGPFIISGAWWARLVERHYYFALGPEGGLQWLYWDARRRVWFCQGAVG